MNLSIGTDGHVLNMLVLDILSDRCVEGIVHNGRLFVLFFHSGELFSGESIYVLVIDNLADWCIDICLMDERLMVDLFYSFFDSGG